ncbi:hypothetical protein MUP65_01670 [Patescibacteria group bacterium]|nr:hypothetical protein [Patescibacteria group bacterium]
MTTLTKSKANKKKSKRNLSVVLITTITVLSWVGFESYRSFVTTKIKPETQQLLIPLDPKLDTQILDNLDQRLGYSREELMNDFSEPVGSFPTESPVPSPASSASAEMIILPEEGSEAAQPTE